MINQPLIGKEKPGSQIQGDPISRDRTGSHRQQGGRVPHNLGHQKRRLSKQQVSAKAKVQRRRGDPPHSNQPWRGQRTPGQRGSRGFQRETADGGGDTPLKPLPCPVSPGCQPGKRARERAMMEAQPSEKRACLNTLCF